MATLRVVELRAGQCAPAGADPAGDENLAVLEGRRAGAGPDRGQGPSARPAVAAPVEQLRARIPESTRDENCPTMKQDGEVPCVTGYRHRTFQPPLKCRVVDLGGLLIDTVISDDQRAAVRQKSG